MIDIRKSICGYVGVEVEADDVSVDGDNTRMENQ